VEALQAIDFSAKKHIISISIFTLGYSYDEGCGA
jgi:hypothetical protein